MMFELKKVGNNTYYISNTTKIGVYVVDDGEVYLIDSGIDAKTGEEILRILEEKNWHLKAIINTHSNADHIGGNHYLQEKTNCKVFAHGIEAAFTRYPIIDPSFLYGGYPCRDLRSKFFFSQGCEVTKFSSPDFPKEIQPIPLPGHYFDMVGFRTPDDVVFLADSLCSKKILDKLGITFIYDVAAYLETLKKLETLQATVFVPSHAEAIKDIRPLAQYNTQKVREIAGAIKSLCKRPRTLEDILKNMFDQYHIKMNFEQYVLVGSTIRSYLAWLKDLGEVTVVFEDNYMLWQRC